jgi:DNA-binding response OmpR family regulator
MPFIFLSALADEEHVIDGLKEGADNYLTKPVDFAMLKATVESSLRQIARIKYKNEDICVLDI